VVPVAHSQDTVGPIARSVTDVALLLGGMAPGHADYTAALAPDALAGKRLGALPLPDDASPELESVYEATKQRLRDAGATVVEVRLAGSNQVYAAERVVLAAEFKDDIDAYLQSTPPHVETRSLEELIAFNARTDAESHLFGDDIFVRVQAGQGVQTPAYSSALRLGRQWAEHALDALLVGDQLDALIGPTSGAAWRIDLVHGDHARVVFSAIPAVAGYPHLTVPMGFVRELPVGLSFVGAPNSDARLLGMGFAFESLTRARHPPRFLETVDRP
jgi:amidase